MCKKPGENFVREVKRAPEGISVLAKDTQISDIVRFCVLPNLAECAPLSVDLTLEAPIPQNGQTHSADELFECI